MKIREISRHTHVVNHVSKRELDYRTNRNGSPEVILGVSKRTTSDCSTESLRVLTLKTAGGTEAPNESQPIPLPPGKPA